MNDQQHQMNEAKYIRLTDLTKLRIARHILCDAMEESLPQRNQITRLLADRILILEDQNDE